MAGYSARQSSYSSGDTITAAHTNDEFNSILAAFHVSTGHTHDGSTAGDGGPISKLFSNALVFGTNADTDIAITFNANSNDGVLTWKEDEDYFEFSDDLLIATTEKIQFRDTAIYIHSSTDGQLDLVADTEIQIAATTVDINGAVDISGNLGVGGNLTVTGNTTFNGGTQTLGDAATDNVVFGADVNSSIIPNTDNNFDLGSSSQEWKDIYIDGIAYLDAINFNGTAISSTAAELNIVDGGTSATSTTVADADRVVLNDNGTMVQVAVTDLAAYFDDEITAMPNLVTTAATTVGALNSGSITSGFGSIDNGSSAITTTGTVTYGSLSDGSITITAFVDEDNMASNSATLVPTQQSVKAYVDTQITAEDLDITTDSGTIAIDLDSETLTVAGGTGLASSASSNTVTLAVDAAQTGITSVVNTSLEIGRDADNRIKFGTDNQIIFEVSGGDNVIFKASGEIEAASLDISGNADIDGTLEADAITVNGTALNTVIAGVTVTNATNSAHVSVADNESTNEENLIPFIEDASATGNVGLESDGDFAYNPSTGTVSATIFKGNIDAVDGDFDGTLEADAITIGGTAIGSIYSAIAGSSSIVTTGALNSGSITSGFGTINNGSSAITTTGTVNFGSLADGTITVTAFVDEDDMSTNSATLVPTQQSVKAYADTKATPGFAVAMAIAL